MNSLLWTMTLLVIALQMVSASTVTVTNVVGGLNGAAGQAFSELENAIYFTEWGTNSIKRYDLGLKTVGTVKTSFCTAGVDANPQDIVLSPGEVSNGKSVFYVTCRNGEFFKLQNLLGVWQKSTASVSGMGAPYQIQIDANNKIACKFCFIQVG
jgi:hypothetical protein